MLAIIECIIDDKIINIECKENYKIHKDNPNKNKTYKKTIKFY